MFTRLLQATLITFAIYLTMLMGQSSVPTLQQQMQMTSAQIHSEPIWQFNSLKRLVRQTAEFLSQSI